METYIILIIIGLAFMAVMLILRYTTYKKMTEKVCSLDPDNDYCRKHYKNNVDKNVKSDKTTEVINEKTPNGGVKTVFYYMDDNNKKTTKKKATKAILREYNEKNEVVHETWANLDE